MAKFNYQQARRQKEVARKSRQQEKQQLRSARPTATDKPAEEIVEPKAADTGEPGPKSGL